MVSMAQVTDSPHDTVVNGRDDAATRLCNVLSGVTAGPSAPYAAVCFLCGNHARESATQAGPPLLFNKSGA
jgi:hypothetical protein